MSSLWLASGRSWEVSRARVSWSPAGERAVNRCREAGRVGGASALPAPAVSTGMASFMGQRGEEGKSARRRLIVNLCAHPSLSEERDFFLRQTE